MGELKLLKSLIDGRYEIMERKGQGSYAEIFSARDCVNNGELVIVKALNTSLQGTPEADLEHTLIRNFQNEAVALDTVRHSNIVRRLWGGTATDRCGKYFQYIVLEYMPGGDLLQKCKQSPFRFDEVLLYMEQVCSALNYAHSCDVIHRDIKPNNLLLSADEKIVKVTDFGVAKIAPQVNEEITRVGTDVYAPPEHHPLSCTGELEMDLLTPSADIYSLAKTIYTLLCGRAPRQFKNSPITELLPEIQKEPWAEGLLEVLRRATDSRVENRYADALSFFKDLKQVDAESLDEVTRVKKKVAVARAVEPQIKEPVQERNSGEGKIVIQLPQKLPSIEPQKRQVKETGTAKLETKLEKAPEQVAIAKKEEKPGRVEKKEAAKEKGAVKPGFWERADSYIFVNRKKILAIWAIVIIIFLSLIITRSIDLLAQNRDQAVVVVRNVAVRTGPTTSSDIIGYLRNGARLEVLQKDQSNWVQVKILDPDDVKTANASLGWVYGEYIKTSSSDREKGKD
jgi:serine/threonine protein kinase